VSASRLAAAAVAAAVVLSGCGGGGGSTNDAQAAGTAVTDFAKAFGAGDGQKSCVLLTPAAQAAFVKRVQVLAPVRDCATAITRIHAAAGAQVAAAFSAAKVVGKPQVKGDSATVTLSAAGHSTTVALKKQGGAWKLAAVPGL
jgi:hypothetical protein